MIKKFEQFDDINKQFQELKDLCDATLAYLIDDEFEVNVQLISRTKYTITGNSFLIRIVPPKRFTEGGFLRKPKKIIPKWGTLKDTIIPLIQLIQKRYHFLDIINIYKDSDIVPIYIYSNDNIEDTILINTYQELEELDDNLGIDMFNMVVLPNMKLKKIFKGIKYELGPNGEIINKEVYEMG